MAQTLREPSLPLATVRRARTDSPRSGLEAEAVPRGFGGSSSGRSGKRRSARKKATSLSKEDWGPLGKHPDLEAIVARQRLHLPLSGRIRESDVARAWKEAAGEHHPDRGGAHDTMQRVNGARDLLLGRG